MEKEVIVEEDGEDIQVCLGRHDVPLYLVHTGAAMLIFLYIHWCKMPYNW